MFCQIKRGLQSAVLVLTSQVLLAGCSVSEDLGTTEQVDSVQQRQAVVIECFCAGPMGTTTIGCYDSCFKEGSVTCGDRTEFCGVVCKFDNFNASPGDRCEAIAPMGNYEGRCAEKGVTPAERAGCCPSCLTEDNVCGKPNDVKACGLAGETCKPCEDDNTNDCKYPACKEGVCLADEVFAPIGNSCTSGSGNAGKCAENGVCCQGCITPGGACLGGNAAGACGGAGEACRDCDNEQACDGAEQCDAGRCVPGTPLACDDNNPCTDDSCDDEIGCENEEDTSNSCSDGDGCTADDECHGDGSCSGTPVVCNDGNDCTDDSCNAGSCEFDPVIDNSPCDDGSSCTEITTCQTGVCTSSISTVCHDTDNPCVTSSCGDDGLGACMQVNRDDDTPCDDLNPCTSDDSCQAGVCGGGGATDCNDNNFCTTDTCDPVDGCSYQNTTGECADGDLCTVNDRCQGGQCVGDEVACPASNECTSSGQCDEASGLCSLLLLEDGTECGNGGECDTGQCVNEDDPSTGTGGTGGGGTGGTSTTSAGGSGTTGEAGAAGETGSDASGGSTSGSTTSGTSGTGGTGGTAGAGGTAGMGGSAGGSGGAGGSGNIGGASGNAGAGGTYSGDDFAREPKGCDCRTAPGSTGSGPAALGLLGLGAMLGGRLRRRKRAH